MSNLVTPELSVAQASAPGLGARLLKLSLALLPWVIIASLLWAGIFIRPQPVGGTVVPSPLERRDQFYGLAALPNGSLLASGSYGKILSISQDGQIRRLATPTRHTLQDIAAWDATHAVAVGNDGVILFSADGGQHWQQAAEVPRSDIANKLNRVRLGADGLAIATGEMGALLISRDFGRSWQRLREEEDVAWNDVAILDGGRLVLVGEFGRLLLGDLTGQNWQEVDAGVGASLMAVTFRDALHGLVIGLEGAVLQTQDGGQSWQPLDVGLREHLFDVAWLEEQGAWFVTGALGRWAAGNDGQWQTGTLDERNLSWHVRALPVAGSVWLAGADLGRWDGQRWSQLQP
jgi:photosystem II stability/assembly factor-like uncharacterized protein